MQPSKKKVTGVALERLGFWQPRKKTTVMRQIVLNTHRARYWLSVGAEPTKGVARLLEKFDMVPPKPKHYGSTYSYEKPVKEYGQQALYNFKRLDKSSKAPELWYRQQL